MMYHFNVYTGSYINGAEVTAIGVMIAANFKDRVVSHTSEVVTYGVIDLFDTRDGNTIRTFTSDTNIKINTTYDVNDVDIYGIIEKVTNLNIVSVQ